MSFPILHLSHLHRYAIPDLLAFLGKHQPLAFQAMVISGFSERDVVTEIERSYQNLKELSAGLNLQSHQVLCLAEPTDCRFPLSMFSNHLFFPFFCRAFDSLNQELITTERYQILGLADHMIPRFTGINQSMFELKVRQAERIGKKVFQRLFFCGNDPQNWQERPRFQDPTHAHFPVILHGNGAKIGMEDTYFGIGAEANSFNVLTLDGMEIHGQQFQRDGRSWSPGQTFHHTVRSMACK